MSEQISEEQSSLSSYGHASDSRLVRASATAEIQRSSAQSSALAIVQPDWSMPLQTVLDEPPSTLPLRLALAGLFFLGCFGAWAWFGQINEVAHAQGKLIPKGDVYKINPTAPGQVSRILVREGQSVKKQQVLMELDPQQSNRDVERLDKELTAARTELNQTQQLLQQAQMQADSKLLIARSQTKGQVLESQKAQESIRNAKVMRDQLQGDAKAHQERLDRLKPLADEGAISKERQFEAEEGYRARERSITEAEGTLEQAQAENRRLQESIARQKVDEQNIALGAQQQIQQLNLQVSKLKAKISQLQTLISGADSKVKEHYLRSPIQGKVSTLNVRNAGEVVQVGQPLAEITPVRRPLVLSAVIPNQEAGLVKVGMPVQVKMDAFPFQDYGVIPGKVKEISPDAKADPKLGQVYRLEVVINMTEVAKRGKKIEFKSGQTANAEIVTRQRRIMDVLIDPIRQLRKGGMNL